MTAGGEPARDESDRDEAAVGRAPAAPPRASRVGARRRQDLRDLLEDDDVLTGTTDMMVESDPESFRHRVILFGERLSRRGGPAREVIGLANRLALCVEAIMPSADAHLESLAGANSVEVVFYAPKKEIEAADRRRAELRYQTSTDDLATVDGPHPEVLPDTSLAIYTLTHILAHQDASEAAAEARAISTAAADQIRELALELSLAEVSLSAEEIRPGARATPVWAQRVVEYLDAAEEVAPTVATIVGVLQGANSRGSGSFEIVPDPDVPLDPGLGRRRSPRDPIRGTLTPRARKEIRDGNLWDTHVQARVRVIRRRKGRSERVVGYELVSARLRFRD